MAELLKSESPVSPSVQDITEALKSLSMMEVKLQNWFVLMKETN